MAYMLMAKGIKRGVSDLFIPLARKGKHGLWLELKSLNGIVSSEQSMFLRDMAAQDYHTAVCYTIEDAIKQLQLYLY